MSLQYEISPEIVDEIIKSDSWVAVRFAENPLTPPVVVEKLLKHEDERVALTALMSSHTDTAVIAERIVEEQMDWHGLSSISARAFRSSEVEAILNSGLYWVKRWAAANPNTSPEILARLAANAQADVLISLAANPNTNEETLAGLMKAKSYEIVSALASRSDLSSEDYDRFSRDKRVSVRSAIASNEAVSLEILERVFRDDNSSVREACLTQSRLPMESIDWYLNSVLTGSTYSLSWYETDRLTAHPNTPISHLRRMLKANLYRSDRVLENPSYKAELADVRASLTLDGLPEAWQEKLIEAEMEARHPLD